MKMVLFLTGPCDVLIMSEMQKKELVRFNLSITFTTFV
jgi:hypothetical protein